MNDLARDLYYCQRVVEKKFGVIYIGMSKDGLALFRSKCTFRVKIYPSSLNRTSQVSKAMDCGSPLNLLFIKLNWNVLRFWTFTMALGGLADLLTPFTRILSKCPNKITILHVIGGQLLVCCTRYLVNLLLSKGAIKYTKYFIWKWR